MKDLLKKSGIVLVLGIILISFAGFLANLIIVENIDYKLDMERMYEYNKTVIPDYSRVGGMVGSGDNNMSVTPIDAYIQNGYIFVKATLKNNTGYNLRLRDFGIASADYVDTYFSTDYEDKTILNKDESREVVFNIGAYDVMQHSTDYPTTIIFPLGAYNKSNDNYYEFDLKFTIAWSSNYNPNMDLY